MAKLTTHVLDTSAGIPAAGVHIDVHELTPNGAQLLSTITTAENGRSAQPLLEGERFRNGRYSLTFHVGDYFRKRGIALPDPPFIDEAVVQIGIARADEHYHVPLLITPWSYSVYRGG